MIFTKLYAANSWDSVAKTQEKGFFDFEFITWMAWTWQTAAFFIFIACCLIAMTVWEKKKTWRQSKKRNFRSRYHKRRSIIFISSQCCIYPSWLAWFDRPNVMGGNYYFVFLCYFCIQVRIIIL